jgi:tRNA 2-selenouridine synthase SelU
MAMLKNPDTIEPVHIKLTEEQKKAIVEYAKKTGHQPAISLLVDVVEGKIAPAAVTVGAA